MCQILDNLADGTLLAIPDATLAGPHAAAFKTELTALFPAAHNLIADLSQVRFIDSSGCGVLLWAHKALKERGGCLIVCGIQPPVRALFGLLRLGRVLRIVASREQALALANPEPRAHQGAC